MAWTVYKLNWAGEEVWQYAGTLRQLEDHFVCLEAPFSYTHDLDLGFVCFQRGDLFVEYFYNDRWYNIFAVYGREDGQLKGWYCNLCRPSRFSFQTVCCEDLALDLWVAPDGTTLLLDEEEFEQLPLAEQEREMCRHALASLLQLAQENKLPH